MKILLINQAFYPDVVATALHASDLAHRLSTDGHQVTVIASRCGYDNASDRYAKTEVWNRVRIIRIGNLGLGKGARWRRMINFATFFVACAFRLIAIGRQDLVVSMTSPPLISTVAALFVRLKGGRLVQWVMDLNPDEAIAAGWLRERSLAARGLEQALIYSLHTAAQVVVLDEFMRARVIRKGIACEKVEVIPPWCRDRSVHYDQQGRQKFREEHGLEGKFVVMYSGNHSPCHPLTTLLRSAARLAHRTDIVFCFVGGGAEFHKVSRFAHEHGLHNITWLPYQSKETLSASLSAADLHAVVMGDKFLGILHPSKIYNVISLGIPFLYIGPERSHVTEMLPRGAAGVWARLVKHGDVDFAVQHVIESARIGPKRFPEEARFAQHFSEHKLVQRFARLLVASNNRRDNDLTTLEAEPGRCM